VKDRDEAFDGVKQSGNDIFCDCVYTSIIVAIWGRSFFPSPCKLGSFKLFSVSITLCVSTRPPTFPWYGPCFNGLMEIDHERTGHENETAAVFHYPAPDFWRV
jgi:hypothetical protein